MTESKHIPEIRFISSEELWEEDELGVLTDVYDGTHQTPKYTSSGIIFLSVENIKTLHSEKYISKECFESEFKVFPMKNDVLMTRIGDIGTANVVESDLPKAYYVSLALLKYKKLDPYFLKNSLASSSVKKDIWHRTLHIAFPKKINMGEIAKVLIPHPSSDIEQKAIGSYFKNLDDQITLKQRKLDKLVTLKKAMLEKMFPKEGADKPEIRFKGFSGAWKERSLLDNFEKIIDFRGRTPKKLGLDWSNSGYLALSALNVKNGYIDFSVDAHFGDQQLYDNWMSGNELHKNQVLFTTEAPMGNVAQIPDDNKYILSQRTIAFVVKEHLIEENFLAVCLRSPKTFEKLTSLSSGGTAKGVSQKSLSTLLLSLPLEIDEQKKIGSYFKNLDNLISLQKKELTKLKQIKSSCLAKMFV